ncbi:RHS repeat-associated core domain-containing protein [Pseudomonas lini]
MSSPQQLILCHYCYDPLDRLSGHTLAASAPLQRFYCKSRLATEIDGAISRSIVQHGDQLLAQSETSGTARQTTLLATDQQRSVLHAVASSGQHPLAYAPYGHRPASNGLLNLLGFNGERPDPVTGHYLLGNGYRAFNPVLMRFNSPDSLSPFNEGGLNPYAYCLGDPINNTDPTGGFILPSRLKFLTSGWIDKTRDRISTAFARSIGSSTQTISSSKIKISNTPALPPPNTHKSLEKVVYQPRSLTDSSLNSITHKNSKHIIDQAPPQYRERIVQLDNLRGQKIAAELLNIEPNNKLFKLAATRQLEGGAEWAKNLPKQSKVHTNFMLHFNNHSYPDLPHSSTFGSLRLRNFHIRREQIYRQEHLNLRGR